MADTAIIIPVYATAENGRSDFLPQTLNSVLRQTYQNFLCLVVDDGSSDKGVKGIVEGFTQSDSRFRYVHRERKPTDRQTASNARNRGLEEILRPSGILTNEEAEHIQFLAFLDSDDLLPRNSLEKRVSYLRENPEAGAVYSDLLWFKESRFIWHFRASSEKGDNLVREATRYCAFPPHTLTLRIELMKEMDRVRSPNGRCEIFNSEISYGEDRDVAICALETALKIGYGIGHIKQVLYFYRGNPSSIVNTTSEEAKKSDEVLLGDIHRGFGHSKPPKKILFRPYLLLPEPAKKMLRPVRNYFISMALNVLYRGSEEQRDLLSSLNHLPYTNSTSTSSPS